MRRAMVGLLVAGLAWGGLSVPPAAALTLSGDEVVVWEPGLHAGFNTSTTLDIAEAGNLVLSAAGSVPATESRTLTDGTVEGEPALEGSGSASHELYVAAAAGIDGTLAWPQAIRATEVTGDGSVTGGQTVTASFTPQVAGPASFEVAWSPEKVTGQVTRTAQGIGVNSSSQQQSSSVDDPPDLFEVNAKVDANGNPAPVQGTLTWEQPTVPSRNLDLELHNIVTGETEVSDALTGDEEHVSMAVADEVTLADGHLFSFDVRNRSTETHDYTLAWEYHRLAEVHVALYDPDGQLVDSATGAVHGQTIAFDVPEADEGLTYTAEITSQDYTADYDWVATYNVAEHARVRLELLDRTDQVVASVTEDDGDIDLSHVAPESGAHTWRITNTEDDSRGEQFEAPVPSYTLAEDIVLLDDTAVSGVLPAGTTSGGTVEVSDPGPISANVTWDSAVGGRPLDHAATVGAGSSSTTSIRVTDDGPIEATLDWEQPVKTIIESGAITPGVQPTAEYAVPVGRTGLIGVLLRHESSITADFVLELLDPDGTVVATAGPGPNSFPPPSTVSLGYTVPEYTEGQGDYTLRVSTEGTGGDYDIDIDYPTTADLSLQLRRDGETIDEIAGRGQTLTYQHTGGERADYQLRVVSADRAADYTLAGHYPAHAPVTATLQDEGGAAIATGTADEGELTITGDAPTAGSYTLEMANDSTELDTPSYDATVLAPARHDVPVEVALLDPDFNVVAALAAGETQTIPVTAGQYRINATSAVSGSQGHIEAYMAFDIALDAPTPGAEVWGVESLAPDVAAGVDIAETEFLVDRHRLAVLDAPATSHDWDTTLVNDGEHAITVRVTDSNGRVAEATTGAIVSNATPGSGRLQIDHENGKLTGEQFARYAVAVALGGDVPAEYVTVGDEGIGATVLHAVSAINELDEATQQHLVEELEFRTGDEAETAGPLSASSSSGSFECSTEPSRGIGDLSSDCHTTIGDYDVYWHSDEYGSSSIPADVQKIGEALVEATSVYGDDDGLDFDRPFVPDVCVCQVLGGNAAFSVPRPIELVTGGFVVGKAGSIVIDPDLDNDPDPRLSDSLDYVAAHELFHTYQYEFVGPINMSAMSRRRRSDTNWWMEATAEWAAHQWAAEVGHPSTVAARKDYYEALQSYFDVVQEGLAGPIRSVPGDLQERLIGQSVGHRYGAFVVAEWFHHDRGPQAIRQIWQGVDFNTSPIESMWQELPGGFDAADVGTLWRDLYFLDLAIPDRINKVETDTYRDVLLARGDDEDHFGVKRMPGNHVEASDLPYRNRAEVGPGGVKVIEFSSPDQSPVTVEVTEGPHSRGTLTAANVKLFPLANYDPYPDNTTSQGEIDLCVPPEPTQDIDDGYRIEVPADKQEPCKGYALIITNGSLLPGQFLDVTVRIRAGEATSAVLDNGTVLLGVHDAGNLGVTGYGSARSGITEDLMLRLKARNAEGIAHNASHDSWGILDGRTGESGAAHVYESTGYDNIDVRSTSWGPSTGVWRTRMGRLVVTHAYAPSSEDGLFRIYTRITNRASNPAAGGGAGYASTDVTYRRGMGWRVPGYGTGTPLGAYLTIGSPTGDLPASVHEALARSFPADPGDGVPTAAEDGIFTDHGPSDTGTMADIYFPASELAFGESVSFVQFYGVRPSEDEALDDLKAVGADLWSLGQAEIDPTDGKPNTFIWGYKELQAPRP